MSSQVQKVFVAQRTPRFDMSGAAAFGELVYLIDDHAHPMQVDQVALQVAEGLSAHGFDPAVDYVALSGHAAVVPVLLAVAAQMAPRLRVLLFDSKTSGYVPRVLDLGAAIRPARAAERVVS